MTCRRTQRFNSTHPETAAGTANCCCKQNTNYILFFFQLYGKKIQLATFLEILIKMMSTFFSVFFCNELNEILSIEIMLNFGERCIPISSFYFQTIAMTTLYFYTLVVQACHVTDIFGKYFYQADLSYTISFPFNGQHSSKFRS